MKKRQLGILMCACSCLAFANVAWARNDVENFKLNAWFGISKCVKKTGGDGQTKTDCEVVTPEQPVQASIALETCEKLPNSGGTSCSGQWTDTRAIESQNFVGTIRVTKTTDASGKSSYVVLSRTEQKDMADSITLHILLLAKTTVTDSSISFGKSLMKKDASGNDMSFVPILAVANQIGFRGMSPRLFLLGE